MTRYALWGILYAAYVIIYLYRCAAAIFFKPGHWCVYKSRIIDQYAHGDFCTLAITCINNLLY